MRVDKIAHPGPECWFALHVRPRSEKAIATAVQQKGFEEFLPLYECRRAWSDRTKWVKLPLFPGYLFCRLNPHDRLSLLTIPGVLHIVTAGNIPVVIDESEIMAIRMVTASGLQVEPFPFLKIGERIRLEHGPLAGLEGHLVEVRNQSRLVVSVSVLKRSVAVEVAREWVAPLGGQRSLAIQ